MRNRCWNVWGFQCRLRAKKFVYSRDTEINTAITELCRDANFCCIGVTAGRANSCIQHYKRSAQILETWPIWRKVSG